MIETRAQFIVRALKYRRTTQAWVKEGFVRIAEDGDPLWRLHRGNWIYRKIIEARVAPGGKEVWIKVEAGAE